MANETCNLFCERMCPRGGCGMNLLELGGACVRPMPVFTEHMKEAADKCRRGGDALLEFILQAPEAVHVRMELNLAIAQRLARIGRSHRTALRQLQEERTVPEDAKP